jgi:hypothetical protein
MQRILFTLLLFLLACESPFNTEPTDDDIFAVSHDYNGDKIYHPTPVTIEWSNITIKKFKEFLVERSATYGDSVVWVEIAHIEDSLQTAFTDTIDDDVTFQYRVRIVDQNDQFIHALSAPLKVPNVSSLKVPKHYEDPQLAFDSNLIDDGDTINIYPGLFQGHFQFLDKDVTIKSITIPEMTLLGGLNTLGSVVEINAGKLEGLTIIGGEALYGGGVWAKGNTIIQDCIIRNNRAIEDVNASIYIYPMGKGGGVYLQDNAMMINSKVTRNISQREGAGVMTDGDNTIIKCQIYKNSVYSSSMGTGYNFAGIYQHQGRINIRNSIIRKNSTNGEGGGIGVKSETLLQNCLISQNSGSSGGGGLVVEQNGNATIVNCVFFKNSSNISNSSLGGAELSGTAINRGELSFINTIAWQNNGGWDKHLFNNNSIYTNSDEFRVPSGLGNIDEDPLFINADQGNFQLQSSSPCLHTGHPDTIYDNPNGSRNDMGIYGGPYGNDW